MSQTTNPNALQYTPTSSNWPYLVHIASIAAIATVLLGLNGIFFNFVKSPDDVAMLAWSFMNVSGLVGMSYYLANVTVSATGFNETTTSGQTA